jgi:hypothetical protein
MSVPFDSEHDSFGLPDVQVLTKLLYMAPVAWARDREPGKGLEIDRRG